MSMKLLSEVTFEYVADLERARTVPVLPVGATEAHGPHLPLATDNLIAQAMARDGGHRLASRGFNVLILPTLAYTPAAFARAFPGTVSMRPSTLVRTVVDIARSLGEQGFELLAVANAHLDPAHLGALEEAVAHCQQEGFRVVFPNLARPRWGRRMTEEFKTGACHAGRYESSVVLAERPALVLEGIRRRLPPNPASLSEAIGAGKESFEDAGGPLAYFGWPADASAEEGREVVRILGSILEDAVAEAFEDPAAT